MRSSSSSNGDLLAVLIPPKGGDRAIAVERQRVVAAGRDLRHPGEPRHFRRRVALRRVAQAQPGGTRAVQVSATLITMGLFARSSSNGDLLAVVVQPERGDRAIAVKRQRVVFAGRKLRHVGEPRHFRWRDALRRVAQAQPVGTRAVQVSAK